MRASIPRLALLTLSLALPVGCGGGGGGSGIVTPVTVTLVGASSEEGTVSSDGALYIGSMVVGDGSGSPPNVGNRAFLSFELGALPPGVRIQSATLRVYQWQVIEKPYTAFGSVLVDHVVYGTTLEAGAYSRSPLAAAFAVLSSDATLGPRSISVTSRLQLDLDSGHPQTQYRLRFPVETNNDTKPDGAYFDNTRDAPTPDRRPQLVVTYLP